MNLFPTQSAVFRLIQWSFIFLAISLAAVIGLLWLITGTQGNGFALYDEKDQELYHVLIRQDKVVIKDMQHSHITYQPADKSKPPEVSFAKKEFQGIIGIGMQLVGTSGLGISRDGSVMIAIPALILLSLLFGGAAWSYTLIRRSYETEIKQLHTEKALLLQGAIYERKRMFSGIHASSLNPLDQLYRDMSEVLADLPKGELQSSLNPIPNRIFDIRNALRDLIDHSYPKTLTEFGLDNALRSYLKPFHRKGVEIRFQNLDIEMMRLPEKVRYIFYQIAQDAFNNAFKEDVGASVIEVSFMLRDDHAILEVKDNGKGFVIPKSFTDWASEGHFGLFQMKENAETIRANLSIKSVLNQGTTIQLKYGLNKA